ncbi:hypothetical protein HPB52_020947 [Rhipicephalus sanguineus]|uniref:Uncharacterized protein n=1 Tax=Rhipicephalus sanguineus TaxID=34632 RepID=A0A9D4PP01_RHISA|nr:hypothetical protein HPB52_020947 [Rhipicephalus sanguineus]
MALEAVANVCAPDIVEPLAVASSAGKGCHRISRQGAQLPDRFWHLNEAPVLMTAPASPKADLNKPHSTTWHSWTGLAALLLSLVEGTVGMVGLTLRTYTRIIAIFVAQEGKQYPWLKYPALRRVHRVVSLSAHGFVTAAMALGLLLLYGRQALAKALGTDTVALQLVVQVLTESPFAFSVQLLS